MPVVSNTPTPAQSAPPTRIKNGLGQIEKTRWLIYGPAGVGKTTMGFTIDEPKNILLIGADTNPATSLIAQGIEVPNLLDMQEVMFYEKKNIYDTITIVMQEAMSFVRNRPQGEASVVFDGLTMLNAMLAKEAVSESDTQKMWLRIQSEQTRLLLGMSMLPCPLVWIAHSGIETSDVRNKENDVIKREAQGITQEEKLRPDVVGKNANLFINQTDVSGFLKKIVTPKGEEKRVFYPDGGAMARGKSRFEAQLDPNGEDPHLRNMISKIKAKITK